MKTRRDGRELTMFDGAQDKEEIEAQKRERKPTTKRTFGGAGLQITSSDAGSEGVFDHRPVLVQDKSIVSSSLCTSLLRQQSSGVAESAKRNLQTSHMNSFAGPESWSELVNDLGQQLQHARAKVDELEWEKEQLIQMTTNYVEWATEAQGIVYELEGELDEERRANRILRRELEAHSKLLRIRGTDLRNAQAYYATVDTVSHTDVIRALDTLNSEIFQFAAHVFDGLSFPGAGPPKKALGGTSYFLGHGMVDVLAAVSRGHGERVGVRVALQAASVRVAFMIVTSWAARLGPNAALHELYWMIHATETQGIAAKWKALVMHHGSHMQWQQEDLRDMFLDVVEYVILLAGGRTMRPSFRDDLDSKVGQIVRLSVQLRSYISKNIASCDFTVVAPRAREAFDGHLMYDENAFGGSVSVGPVLCTMGLGLCRQKQTRKPGGASGGVVATVVKKASVMLEDVVRGLLPAVGDGGTT